MTQQPFIIDDRKGGVFRVHRSVFTSQAVFERERAAIFNNCWLYVGHESEVAEPNAFLTREVAGRPLIFNRDPQGNLRVFVNSCRHRGAQVCRDPHGKRKIFTCMYHGWAFDNTGRLVSVPAAEDAYGPEFDRSRLGLHEPRHAAYRGFVFVTFGADVPGLDDYLGDAKYEIDLIVDQSPDGVEMVPGVHRYSMRANWKLLMENSVDGYHAISTHQSYFEMVSNLVGTSNQALMSRGSGRTSQSSDLGGGHSVITVESVGNPVTSDEVRQSIAANRIATAERMGEPTAAQMLDRARNRIVFPTFAIVDLNFGIAIRTMHPLAPDHTAIFGCQIMPRGLPESVRRHRIDNSLTFWGPAGLATPDDVVALEECQRGYTSVNEVEWNDISRGMLREETRTIDERQMRAFWREWNFRVTGEPNRTEGKPYDRSYRDPPVAAEVAA